MRGGFSGSPLMSVNNIAMEPLLVYIGYDWREKAAWEVCASSMRRHSSRPLMILPLKVERLQHAGLYRREWRHDGGNFIDVYDGKPFSTNFAFTRFLVPALCQWEGLALFCDCDFLWRSDVADLFSKADPKYAVQVVKHDHRPRETEKMGGVGQTRYWRKNWSSLILYQAGHRANMMLTPHRVNNSRGQYLHAFGWLDGDEIGSLDERWNWLCGYSDPQLDPFAIHFTGGGPWLPDYRDVPYGDEWREEAARIGIEVDF